MSRWKFISIERDKKLVSWPCNYLLSEIFFFLPESFRNKHSLKGWESCLLCPPQQLKALVSLRMHMIQFFQIWSSFFQIQLELVVEMPLLKISFLRAKHWLMMPNLPRNAWPKPWRNCSDPEWISLDPVWINVCIISTCLTPPLLKKQRSFQSFLCLYHDMAKG